MNKRLVEKFQLNECPCDLPNFAILAQQPLLTIFFGRQVEQYALIKFIFLQLDKFYVYSFIDKIEILDKSAEILFQWPGGLLSYW